MNEKKQKHNGANRIAFVVIGSAIASIIGFLFGTKKGKEVKEKIKNQASTNTKKIRKSLIKKGEEIRKKFNKKK